MPQWPMSPFVQETNLTWWPCSAHLALVPPALSSQSSGCAPKTMMRNLPSPNIFLILADDLGWTDLSCSGSELYETPHIDRLARDGMKFTQAYSACTVCSPTRAAILTGKYPARVHVTDWIPGQMPENPKL